MIYEIRDTRYEGGNGGSVSLHCGMAEDVDLYRGAKNRRMLPQTDRRLALRCRHYKKQIDSIWRRKSSDQGDFEQKCRSWKSQDVSEE